MLLARRSQAASPDNAALDSFIARYMKAMNAPGMTLAIARRDGPARVATFGFSDLESRTPVTPDHLFQVGSISKSFVGLTCLQLHDEGKLDFGGRPGAHDASGSEDTMRVLSRV